MSAKSITQTVARGFVPFTVQVGESAKYRSYLLRELAESKKEAIDPDTVLENHADFINKWEAKRMSRQNAIYN